MKFQCLSTAVAQGLSRGLCGSMLALTLLAAPMGAAHAELSIGIGFGGPGVSIGINFSEAPRLTRVPGYPVYYAPQLQANLFFYDGLYWIYLDDSWYAGSWYNGPWTRVGPEYVPLYVLRIPVRYYRAPPEHFRNWRPDAPPRWDEHWGRDWAERRSGWDRWDRRNVPAPAPLPSYQRKYFGDRYPEPERQQELRRDNYRYQPRDAIVREHFQQPARRSPEPAQRPAPHAAPDAKGPAHRPGNPPRQSPGEDRKGERDEDRDKDKDKDRKR